MASSDLPQKPFHVAVCGGGIGGLCMAIGLLHQNIPCTVYEAAPAFAEIGAGVSFGINAIRAMSLIDPKVKEAFDRCATSNGSPDRKTHYFDFRIGMKEEGWSAMKGGAPANEGTEVAEVIAADVGQASVHRAHFLDELVKLIPEGVAKFGKRVQKVERKGEKMQMTFCDGTTAEADAVIGCDGIKSRTRQIVLGEDHPAANAVFSGWYAYRGLVPMEKAALALGDDLARNSQIYMGHGAHVLTFPIEHGKVMNVVAFQTKKTWDDEAWVLPMRRDQMLDDFKDWDDKVKDMLSNMEKPDVWALFDHPPAPTYCKGRLVLLGDAAHATTPHQGAGAGQAIEDAFVLSNLFGKIDSVDKIENAFKAYDEIRRPRTQKVVTTSRDVANVYEFLNEKLGGDLKEVRSALETWWDWIWYEDLEEQLKRAENLMAARANLK